MRITKKELANYLGIHRTNVKHHYQGYLDALQITKRDYITVYDIAQVDDVSPVIVAKMCNKDTRFVAIVSESIETDYHKSA